jgi:hypothetical protein
MYGLSWQVVPTLFFELLSDPDPVTSQAVVAAMLEMNKLVSASGKRRTTTPKPRRQRSCQRHVGSGRDMALTALMVDPDTV